MTDYSPCAFPVIGANLRYEAHSFPFSSTVAGDHPMASRKCEERFARSVVNPLYSLHRARAKDCDSGLSQLLSLKGGDEIGRASCRARVCPYVSISVVAVSLKNKISNYKDKLYSLLLNNPT